VNDANQTSDPDIYAVGDAVEKADAVSHATSLIALANVANRQGRRVADHIAGRPSHPVASPRRFIALSPDHPRESPHVVITAHQVSSYLQITPTLRRRRRSSKANRHQRSTTTGHDPNAGRYEIRLQGHLQSRWSGWFDGMTVINDSDGTTLLRGPVVDQAALHGLLRKLRSWACGCSRSQLSNLTSPKRPPTTSANPRPQRRPP